MNIVLLYKITKYDITIMYNILWTIIVMKTCRKIPFLLNLFHSVKYDSNTI